MIRALFNIGLILLLNACVSKKSAIREDGDERLPKALSLFKQGAELLYNNDEEAIAKFKKASEIDKNLFPAFHNLGVALENLSRPLEAKESYKSCLAINKKAESCLYNLVFVMFSSMETDALNTLLSEYSTEFPDEPMVNVAYAKLFYLQNNFAEAEKRARLAIERQAENVDALYVMAQIFFAKEQYNAAKWVSKNALEIAPRNGGMWLLLGHTLYALDLIHDALDAYEKSYLYQPNKEAIESYALLLQQMGQVPKSLLLLEKLVKLAPDDFDNQLNLGNLYMANKDFEQAKESYQKALKLDPSKLMVNFNLGLLYFDFKPKGMKEIDRLKKAQEYFTAYLSLKGLSKDKVDETNGYLKLIKEKITMEEWSAAEPEEEIKPEEEPKKEVEKEPEIEQEEEPIKEEEPAVKEPVVEEPTPKKEEKPAALEPEPLLEPKKEEEKIKKKKKEDEDLFEDEDIFDEF